MITEIRPGFFQYTYPNGVTHSFSAPNRKAAERIVEDQIRRLEKRQGMSLTRKLWGGKRS